MLFDLRSRGRRRTVQVVYLGLALLMGGGLVLFGVGAGNGFGGILNAFTGGSSNNAATQAVSAQEKAALKATSQRPRDPQAWASLVQARYESAAQGNNYDANTGQYTAAGVKELRSATQAWTRYQQLTTHPSPDLAVLVARAYDGTGDYASEARAWEIVSAANPTVASYFEYLAAAAYKAKQVRKGDLAAAKAVSLTPQLQRLQVQQTLTQVKTAALPQTQTTAAPSTAAPSAPTPTTSSTGK